MQLSSMVTIHGKEFERGLLQRLGTLEPVTFAKDEDELGAAALHIWKHVDAELAASRQYWPVMAALSWILIRQTSIVSRMLVPLRDALPPPHPGFVRSRRMTRNVVNIAKRRSAPSRRVPGSGFHELALLRHFVHQTSCHCRSTPRDWRRCICVESALEQLMSEVRGGRVVPFGRGGDGRPCRLGVDALPIIRPVGDDELHFRLSGAVPIWFSARAIQEAFPVIKKPVDDAALRRALEVIHDGVPGSVDGVNDGKIAFARVREIAAFRYVKRDHVSAIWAEIRGHPGRGCPPKDKAKQVNDA